MSRCSHINSQTWGHSPQWKLGKNFGFIQIMNVPCCWDDLAALLTARLKFPFPWSRAGSKSCCIPQIFVAELAAESREIILYEFYP